MPDDHRSEIPDVRPSRYVRATITDEGGMLLDLRGRGKWYALPPSAACWWRHVVDGETADEAVERVAEHFRVEATRVRTDIHNLVAELVRRRLVEPSKACRRWWRTW